MKIRGLRWWIVTLLFGAAVLNDVDRQTLSALAPTIQRDLALDDCAYADIVNLFLVASTLAYLVVPLATHAYPETMPAVASLLGQGAGWRIAFLLTGLAGLLWLIPWRWLYRRPAENPWITEDELKLTWIVYAAAGVGSVCGGWLSGQLVQRGHAPASSRLWLRLGCACLMPLCPFIAQISGLPLAITLTGCVVFATLAWLILKFGGVQRLGKESSI